MKYQIINILDEFQDEGIIKEGIKRIETLYPEAEKWELNTVLIIKNDPYIYEKMGYIKDGESKKINNRLKLVNYIKSEKMYMVKDIKK